MCTAISYQAGSHYFGRNLDLEYGYQESVTVTPRNYPFHFRHLPPMSHHFSMIGTATVSDGYPLYYEATNEHGLSVAGLNFPGLAHYSQCTNGKDNVAVFELIPWLLGQCSSIEQVRGLLDRINLVDTPFSSAFKPSPLHWMICDGDCCLALEAMSDGLHIHENPIGVLTNNPPFDFHLYHLRNYLSVSPDQAINRFSEKITLDPYSNGMGGLGIPGDWSSASRFIRAAFVKSNSPALNTDDENINQFFHILRSVAMPLGSIRMRPNEYEITRYTCCCNTKTGVYYYTTYQNARITCVDMHKENLDGCKVVSYPHVESVDILKQNQR